jgi:hypothetical protein
VSALSAALSDGAARRKTFLTRATTSRGLNGLTM